MAVVIKVVDDILLTGKSTIVDSIIEKINSRFILGTIVHGPGSIHYYGLNILQHDDYTIEVAAEDKINYL